MKKIFVGIIVIILIIAIFAVYLIYSSEKYWCENKEVYKVILPCCDQGIDYYDKDGQFLASCGGGDLPRLEDESATCQELLKLKCDKRKYF